MSGDIPARWPRRIVGSKHATEVELKEVCEGDSVAEADNAGDLVVVTIDVAVRLVRHVERRRELARILPAASRAARTVSAYPALPCSVL
jgi:hypothetical protein